MKLLNKSIRSYILYASIILIIAIPVLYFAIQRVVAENVDESLTAQKEKIASRLKRSTILNPLPYLETFEADVVLIPAENISNKKDTFYTITAFDTTATVETPYRVLESKILFKDKTYAIQLKSSLLDNEDLIESIITIVVILLFLIVTGLVLINRVLSKKLWQPFHKTIEKLNGFKIEENSTIQFEKNDVTEFTALNDAIATLTNRNREVYQSQRQFTENASHEMQTPLAIFQGKLDLLMQTKPLNQEQYELINDLADVNQRMSKLNKSLLLLTKIENNQFAEIENVSIKLALEKLIEQYRFQAEQKNITIENEFTGDINIKANKTLIEIMLGNLLSNAIKHNIINGYVVIKGGSTVISFINTSGTTRLNPDKMFQRFQKQAGDNTGIGIGLQIAKKIAELYHCSINYNFHNQQQLFNLSVN